MPDGDNGFVNAEALRGYVGRVENLHEQRDALNADIREVYAEAKDAGIDTTTLREIVREQRMDGEARNARYAMLDQYRRALGMLADTPLGQAAEETLWTGPQPAADRFPRPAPFDEQPARRRGRPRKAAMDHERWPAPVPFDEQPARRRGRPRKAAALDGDPVARAGDFRPL